MKEGKDDSGTPRRKFVRRFFKAVGPRVQGGGAGRSNCGKCGVKANREDTYQDVVDAVNAWLRSNPHAPRYGETCAEREMKEE